MTQDRMQELKQLRDEIRLKIHLAGMELRDRWQGIEPRLERLEQQLVEQGERLERKAEEVFQELLKEARDIAARLRARASD